MKRNSILIALTILVGVAATGLWVLKREYLEHVDRLGSEVYGILLQFWLVVILGGAVSFILQQISETRERREQERRRERDRRAEETRKLLQTGNELVSAFNKTKRVRLLMRARVLPAADGSPAEETVSASAYDEQMETLIDAKLEFESIERRVIANPYLFDPERYGELRGALDAISEYLRITLEEYEDQRTQFDRQASGERELARLPALREFLGPVDRQAKASAALRMPFETALRCLRLEVQRRSPGDSRGRERVAGRGAGKDRPLGLGLKEGEVRLVAHQRAWQDEFGKEVDRLKQEVDAIGDIEHIGSTAVPNLAATPIVDMLAKLESFDDAEELKSPLAELGYLHVADVDHQPGWLFRRWSAERCTHMLWLAPAESEFSATAIRLRDRLRSDDTARRRYETRKRRLLNTSRGDPDGYKAALGELARETAGPDPAQGRDEPH